MNDASSAGPRSRYSSGAEEGGDGFGTGRFGASSGRWGQATSSTWDFFASGSRGEGAGADRAPPGPDEAAPAASPSDITVLSRSELEAVLPVLPNGRQAAYYQPKSLQERLVQLLGSIGASMVLSKSVVLAAPALLYPIWSPWLQAGAKNLEVYTKGLKCLGLWRATVLEVEVLGGTPFGSSWAYGARASAAAVARVRVLMGDPWQQGARVQLEFPYQPKADQLRQGDSVEALVLGRDESFATFKVIREVYAPGLGLWLAEYPFVDRASFLDISLQVERARQVAAGNQGFGAPMGYGAGPIIVDVDAMPASDPSASDAAYGAAADNGYAAGGYAAGGPGYSDAGFVNAVPIDPQGGGYAQPGYDQPYDAGSGYAGQQWGQPGVASNGPDPAAGAGAGYDMGANGANGNGAGWHAGVGQGGAGREAGASGSGYNSATQPGSGW